MRPAGRSCSTPRNFPFPSVPDFIVPFPGVELGSGVGFKGPLAFFQGFFCFAQLFMVN